jgi:hypothetical protein
MNAQLLYVYGELLAANARVEGMVASNQQRVAEGGSPAYGESYFFAESQHMQDLANQALDSEVKVESNLGPGFAMSDGRIVHFLDDKPL